MVSFGRQCFVNDFPFVMSVTHKSVLLTGLVSCSRKKDMTGWFCLCLCCVGLWCRKGWFPFKKVNNYLCIPRQALHNIHVTVVLELLIISHGLHQYRGIANSRSNICCCFFYTSHPHQLPLLKKINLIKTLWGFLFVCLFCFVFVNYCFNTSFIFYFWS